VSPVRYELGFYFSEDGILGTANILHILGKANYLGGMFKVVKLWDRCRNCSDYVAKEAVACSVS
jgi:hypothetical protein